MADNRKKRFNDDFDNYNYEDDNEDRDIYSTSGPSNSGRRENNYTRNSGSRTYSGGTSSRRRKKKKKNGCAAAMIAAAAVLIAAVAVFAGVFHLFTSRTNYKQVDTTSYVDQSVEVKAAPNVENIMLIGADKNPEDGTIGRSDTMLLMSIDNVHKKIRLVSFMRDIYLNIPTVGYSRLNATFSSGGAALTMQTIQNYFGVEINKYVQVDFDSFSEIIDKMGGVDVEIADYEAEFINNEGQYTATVGMNHLNGFEALCFARMRHLDSDFARTGRQREVIIAILDKFKSCSTTQKTKMLYDYLPMVTHNFSDSDILSNLSVLSSLSDYQVETLRIPADGTAQDIYAEIDGVPGNEVLDIDFAENSKLLKDFLYNNN